LFDTLQEQLRVNPGSATPQDPHRLIHRRPRTRGGNRITRSEG
jgi:hypothetical protein